ncbi:hypothetical protein F5Y16DRAFT_69591 [Xylariaceae sp. FL0255]|nr:hypothetical protein F5Y16DRAFT_69591 [Xylariaceae sp. FL0255]
MERNSLPGAGEPDRLFLDSTISRDDTLGVLSSKQHLLAQLNEHAGQMGSPQMGRGQPTNQTGRLPPMPLGRGGPPISRGGAVPYPPPVNVKAKRGNGRSRSRDRSQSSSRSSSGSPGPRSRFPRQRITGSADWRSTLAEQRESHDGPVDSSEIVIAPLETTKTSSRLDDTNDRRGTDDITADDIPARGRRRNIHEGIPETARKKASAIPSELTSTSRSPVGMIAPTGDELERPASTTPIPDMVEQSNAQEQEHSSGAPSESYKPDLGLAEKLAQVTESHFHVDLLDKSKDMNMFIGYLLDTIDKLESAAYFNRARSSSAGSLSSLDKYSTAGSENGMQLPPRGHTLHRIRCDDYSHHGAIYEDKPSSYIIKKTRPHLTGRKRVNALDPYLYQNPDICLVVFKEHHCGTLKQKKASKEDTIRVVSSSLRKVLKKVAYFADLPIGHDNEGLEMDAPYLPLYHYREELNSLAQQEDHQDLKILLEYFDQNYANEYNEANMMISRGVITSVHLEKIFKPNQMVIYQQDSGRLSAAVLEEYPRMTSQGFQFSGWAWSYDGNNLQRKEWQGLIGSLPDGETSISTLAIHPAEYADPEKVQHLQKRGEKFWSMRDHSLWNYTGWTTNRQYRYTDARFMVDVATYYILHPIADFVARNGPPMIQRPIPAKIDDSGPWPLRINREKDISPQVAMLLPPTIFGFNLLEKKWVTLNVDDFHPICWNKKAFDRLVLDTKTKEMIYALVDIQTRSERMDDIIAGKGNGLIVLLHGSPGTGKTLTAESVAEIAEKPLYRVTCGDIGTTAQDVEKYLQSVMYLGKLWDCVLLLDEADVFLEERTMADLGRNSLVSVFLRLLEYYDGILILTSNRVGTFDEAFKSRIQVAIHYDNLTKKSRKQIWRNFFDMLEDSNEEDANMPELERRLDELASEEMNGRQIRNALLTARQLAKHRDERLDWQHLSQVMKTSAAFNKYLKAVRGHSDDQWAREEQLR